MTALITLLVIITVSMLVVRIGSISLQMTGLSKEVASFQAQSAFSGVGFTTAESESVVSHPVRRRLVRVLMLMGTAGITSAVATLIMAFTQSTEEDWPHRLAALLGGVLLLVLVSRLRLINTILTWAITKALAKWTKIAVHDYEQILQVSRGYSLAQILLEEGEWLSHKSLRQLNLTSEGVLVLSIARQDGMVLGAPDPDTVVHPGDKLFCYGLEANLANLSERRIGSAGEQAHRQMMIRHKLSQTAEIALDRETGTQQAVK